METLDKLELIITYKTKTIFGILGIILGFIIWAIVPYSGLIKCHILNYTFNVINNSK